jgi:hypothetical protein
MVSRSSQQLIGQTTRFLYESDEACEVAGREIYSAFAAGISCRYDIVMPDKDGSSRMFELLGSMVDASDPQKGSIWLFSDVSEIRLAQEKLSSSYADLEVANLKLNEMSKKLQLTLAFVAKPPFAMSQSGLIEPLV